jgi:hypothetical protein
MKKHISAILAAALILSAPLAAFADDPSGASTGGNIPGDSTVDTVTLNVVLPTSLNFALDPLELSKTAGGQVKTSNYIIVNKTFAPVKVSFEVTVTPKNDTITLVDDPGTLNKDDINETAKKIYFFLNGANTITSSQHYNNVVENTIPIFVTKKDTVVPVNAGSQKASIAFALAAAVDKDATSPGGAPPDGVWGTNDTVSVENAKPSGTNANTAGLAAFSFGGELNTYAGWEASDVAVTGAYTLVGLRTSTYDGLTAADFAADGANQFANTPKTDVTIAANGSSTVSIARTTAASNGGVTAYLRGKPALSDITLVQSMTANPVYAYPSSSYTYDETTGVFKLTALPSASSATIKITADGDTYTFVLTLT